MRGKTRQEKEKERRRRDGRIPQGRHAHEEEEKSVFVPVCTNIHVSRLTWTTNNLRYISRGYRQEKKKKSHQQRFLSKDCTMCMTYDMHILIRQ